MKKIRGSKGETFAPVCCPGDLEAVGGSFVVADDGSLESWCLGGARSLRDPEGPDAKSLEKSQRSCEAQITLAVRVPLPFDRFWIVGARDGDRVALDGADAPIPLDALAQARRLKRVAVGYAAVRVASISADAFAAAKRHVRLFAKARKRLKLAKRAQNVSPAGLFNARRNYHEAAKTIQTNLAVYYRGHEERQAARTLGQRDDHVDGPALSVLLAGLLPDQSTPDMSTRDMPAPVAAPGPGPSDSESSHPARGDAGWGLARGPRPDKL